MALLVVLYIIVIGGVFTHLCYTRKADNCLVCVGWYLIAVFWFIWALYHTVVWLYECLIEHLCSTK